MLSPLLNQTCSPDQLHSRQAGFWTQPQQYSLAALYACGMGACRLVQGSIVMFDRSMPLSREARAILALNLS